MYEKFLCCNVNKKCLSSAPHWLLLLIYLSYINMTLPCSVSLCQSQSTMDLSVDTRFHHPLNAFITGCSGSGKSYLMKKIVENREVMFDVQFIEVIWHYSEWQDIYDDLAQNHKVTFIEGPPSLDQYPAKCQPKLVVCDDFMDQIKNPEFLKIAIKGSHHRSLSFFLLTQAIFPPHMRQISLQAHYFILMKSPRDIAQIRSFCLQVDPSHWRALMQGYMDATQEGHSYILFDLHVKQHQALRLRTHIFPGEEMTVYIPMDTYKRQFQTQINHFLAMLRAGRIHTDHGSKS